MDIRRAELEIDYEAALIAALKKAAAGSWGLFDHNQDRRTRANWEKVVTELCDLGRDIDQLREDLNMASFGLHAEFEASRGPVASNAPGEPKQAQAWLDRLARREDDDRER